jgi:hypothetical protein
VVAVAPELTVSVKPVVPLSAYVDVAPASAVKVQFPDVTTVTSPVTELTVQTLCEELANVIVPFALPFAYS